MLAVCDLEAREVDLPNRAARNRHVLEFVKDLVEGRAELRLEDTPRPFEGVHGRRVGEGLRDVEPTEATNTEREADEGASVGVVMGWLGDSRGEGLRRVDCFAWAARLAYAYPESVAQVVLENVVTRGGPLAPFDADRPAPFERRDQ